MKVSFIFLIGCFLSCLNCNAKTDQTSLQSRECVILLHGLARGPLSMWFIQRHLKRQGFETVNVSYPSLAGSIEQLAANAIASGVEHCRRVSPEKSIHLVSHSLGGILIRSYLQQTSIAELERIVMLAPPNHGSEIVDRLLQWQWLGLNNIESFKQLATVSYEVNTAYLEHLKPVPGEIGIIAGAKSNSLLFSKWLPNEDDGKVSVASTCLDEMSDWLEVDTNHTLIVINKEVMKQVLYFLQRGQFNQTQNHLDEKTEPKHPYCRVQSQRLH